eukprot:CAMPEP_0115314564 /NCGR_PEP_ID=MMETSP0270-20121206/77102_1 /TAXON_ID=71861 /ORGANISM="Scrippsiella trochoidea, Strain CCMP3099" /LENGTH=220 /DNA_ID=CAMNT_0002733803 /DNA_START=225 /DNA_END=884 /DNA_ORIENTATION=-
MPWHAVPFDSERRAYLKKKFNVRFGPYLIALDSAGRKLSIDYEDLEHKSIQQCLEDPAQQEASYVCLEILRKIKLGLPFPEQEADLAMQYAARVGLRQEDPHFSCLREVLSERQQELEKSAKTKCQQIVRALDSRQKVTVQEVEDAINFATQRRLCQDDPDFSRLLKTLAQYKGKGPGKEKGKFSHKGTGHKGGKKGGEGGGSGTGALLRPAGGGEKNGL